MVKKNSLIKNIHFWLILVISVSLLFVYAFWPWRQWKFIYGTWEWLSWLTFLGNLAIFEVRNHIVGSLFLIPITYAAIAFQWRGALIVTMVALASTLSIVTGLWFIESMLTNISLLLLPAVMVALVTIELDLRRKNKEIFIKRQEEQKEYLTKMLEAQELERQRLSQELHDETIQTLLATASYAEALVSPDENDITQMKEKAAWVEKTIRKTIEDLRRISLDLRPAVLDNLGLVSALRWLTDQTNGEGNIKAELVIKGTEIHLSPKVELTIFRVLQEALRNIKRHAGAKQVTITLKFTPGVIEITIQDDGRGFSPPKELTRLMTEGKLGLVGMQERIMRLDGTLKISSKPFEGTLLSFRIPV